MDSIIDINTNSSSTSDRDKNKPSIEEPVVQIRFDRVAVSHQ
jgi:hypothetical protein